MKKAIPLLLSLTACIPAVHFLMTSSPDSFCWACVLGVITLAAWIDYELYLADRVTDMQLREWQLKQDRRAEVLVTMTALRRELMRAWGRQEI
ncbi:MAG: hypothetical protein E7511_03200 [Ruminococcus sp.]|nr:hypothetical protein [Ruminococcus sp.]